MGTSITIEGALPGLNEYTRINRTNRFGANQCKRDAEAIVLLALVRGETPPVAGPVTIHIDWYEKNRRRDPDNIRFGVKFILDALVRNGVLENDSQRFIKGLSDDFYVDPKNPRVEVTISRCMVECPCIE